MKNAICLIFKFRGHRILVVGWWRNNAEMVVQLSVHIEREAAAYAGLASILCFYDFLAVCRVLPSYFNPWWRKCEFIVYLYRVKQMKRKESFMWVSKYVCCCSWWSLWESLSLHVTKATNLYSWKWEVYLFLIWIEGWWWNLIWSKLVFKSTKPHQMSRKAKKRSTWSGLLV